MTASSLRVFATLLAFALPAAAADHFLTIAGGNAPTSNQISLEKNVIFFRDLLKRANLGDAPHSIYFANGTDEFRDVQFEPADASPPPAQELMARLFGSTKYQTLAYRKHELGAVAGATSPANLEAWFNENAAKFASGDRLIIYATAHGSKSADKENEYNCKLNLWNNQAIDVKQLQGHLAKLPAGVSVTTVMAQCYSGGFANAIFDDADNGKADLDRSVCGFFSTVHSRLAAGCTPDVDEENYDEFTSYFWAALSGETRTGKPIESADYDGNGVVDFEEAFAYTVITSGTIDIPIRTSGVFLRARSKYRHEDEKNEQLLDQKSDFEAVLSLARPAEKAIMISLSEQLGLESARRYAEAETKANEIEQKRVGLQSQVNENKKRWDGLRKILQDKTRNRWPELANLLSEQSIRLMTNEADEFIDAVESQPEFAEWERLRSDREKLEAERFSLEKLWAKHIRFMRIHNNAVLAENLRILGDQKALFRFDEIMAAECRGLAAESERN